MADRAPGYEQAAEDLQCYNCGMRGHLFFACPEDTRRVPAGLEASRKRQASAGDHHASIKRGKGPVVTHYPPPPPLGLPHIPPPPTTYSSGLGYEGFHAGPPPSLPPGPPYHQPPHTGQYSHYQPLNPGRSASRSFPHSNPPDAYEHHFQGAPRAPPPETPYRPPHYDPYDRHRSGPSPGVSYDRPYSAPLDRHDEHHPGSLLQGSPYTGAHRGPPQANFEHYPPAPGVDNYYTGPPQPYPPPPSTVHRNPPHSGYGDSSSAQFYAPSHGSPPPGVYAYPAHQYPPSDPPPYHARYDDRYTDRPSYEPQRRDTHPHYAERRSGGNRQNRERHRRVRYNSPKGRSHSERRFLDRPARVPSPVTSTPPAKSTRESTAPESRVSQQSPSNTTLADNKSIEKYTAEDFSWDEEMIFKELPFKITRDLIREPLPAEWTDDPIMPPKYDKETITSRYINATNVDDFALSVRETKAWQIMQYHPTFLSPTDVRIERLQDYESALDPGGVYDKRNHYSINSSGGRQRGKSWGSRARGGPPKRYPQNYGQDHPSSDDQSNYFRSRPAKRSWERTDYRDSDTPERASEIVAKKPKISSPEPGELCETDDQPTSTSKSPSWDNEYHHIPRDHSANALQNSRASPPDITSESSARRSSLHAPSTPPRRPRHTSPSPSRLSSIRSSRGGPVRASSRRSSRSNSRPSSRQSSIGSPLTPNERELLGMASSSGSSDSGRDSPTPQINDASSRSRQRPAKLHAAYHLRLTLLRLVLHGRPTGAGSSDLDELEQNNSATNLFAEEICIYCEIYLDDEVAYTGAETCEEGGEPWPEDREDDVDEDDGGVSLHLEYEEEEEDEENEGQSEREDIEDEGEDQEDEDDTDDEDEGGAKYLSSTQGRVVALITMITNPLSPSAILQSMTDALSTHEPNDTTSDLSSSHEALALFTHACMVSLGFRLLGFDEDKINEAECHQLAPRLPANWNASFNTYAFVYAHQQSALRFVIKIDRLGGKAEIRGLAVQDERIARVEVTIKDFVSNGALPLRITMTQDGTEDRSGLQPKFQNVFISESQAFTFLAKGRL
ncbi:hypothetical protein O1611_g8168 [Lasiodiplodia mahajangana]|uniref:Uncharacterized protein n=1 Tax=Lasiodiplodia mahajangana TaxID=1108764 RepID=A0ACC2JDF5_9PEZI|nr:hypothetical protein O1611_g8168 [Lasiodiplodia mahajangana]